MFTKKKPGSGGGKPVKPQYPPNTTIPVNLKAEAKPGDGIYLTWDDIPEATTYWTYRNGQVIAIQPPNYFHDVYVTPGVSYVYEIASIVAEILGNKSAPVTITAQ